MKGIRRFLTRATRACAWPIQTIEKIVGPVFQLAAAFIFLLFTVLAAWALLWPQGFREAATNGWVHAALSFLLKDGGTNILEKARDMIVDNAIQMVLTGGGVALLIIIFVNIRLQPELSGKSVIVTNFLHPLNEAIGKSAKIEIVEVEPRAREVLRERDKTLEHISKIYSLLYYDFHELNELMGPEGSPPLKAKTDRIAVECNVKCEGCDNGTGCTCGGPRYVDITQTEAEKYIETRSRIRALLDKIASNRGRIDRELTHALTGLLQTMREAKAKAETVGADVEMSTIYSAILITSLLTCMLSAITLTVLIISFVKH